MTTERISDTPRGIYDIEKHAIAIAKAQEDGNLIKQEVSFLGSSITEHAGLKWFNLITEKSMSTYFSGHCDASLLDEIYLGTKMTLIVTSDFKPAIFEGRELIAAAAVLVDDQYFFKTPTFNERKYHEGILNKKRLEEEANIHKERESAEKLEQLKFESEKVETENNDEEQLKPNKKSIIQRLLRK